MNMSTGSLRYADNNGSYWSRAAYESSLYVFYFHFNSTDVYMSPSSSRWYGFMDWDWYLDLRKLSEFTIYLTHGGYIDTTSGSLKSASYDGYYRLSSSTSSALSTYNFNFGDEKIYPSGVSDRFLGFTVAETEEADSGGAEFESASESVAILFKNGAVDGQVVLLRTCSI